jgi:hypothetical protein
MRNSETVFQLQNRQHVTDKRVTDDIRLCEPDHGNIIKRFQFICDIRKA